MRFPKTPRLVFVFVVTGELLGLNVPARGERPPDRPIRTRTLIAEKDAKIAQLSDVLTKKVEQEQAAVKTTNDRVDQARVATRGAADRKVSMAEAAVQVAKDGVSVAEARRALYCCS